MQDKKEYYVNGKMDDNRRTIGKPNAPYNATKESDVKCRGVGWAGDVNIYFHND
jgi:hypothetical protein